MASKVRGLVIILMLVFAGKNTIEAQEIDRVTGKDGKKIYANTEEVYQLVDNLSFSPETNSRTQTIFIDNQTSQKIDNLIHQISEQHGVDPELVRAVARVESNYNPHAVSYKGALGLMQLLPETAKRFGVRNVWDPQQNIEGGVKFLKFLNEMFPNNLPYVLAAYNAGENAVVKHRGIPPYRETQSYVRRITSLYKKGSILTATSEPDGGIVCYRDEAGRVVYSNLEATYP